MCEKCILLKKECYRLQYCCKFSWCTLSEGGTGWRSWLRHCATSRKVAGSVPDGVIGLFHWNNRSGRTITLGLTQPLIEISTRNISWGVKAAGTLCWQPCHLHVPIVLNLLEPSGPLQPCNGIALSFTFKWTCTLLPNMSSLCRTTVIRKHFCPSTLSCFYPCPSSFKTNCEDPIFGNSGFAFLLTKYMVLFR
jgi:hypothetical protein